MSLSALSYFPHYMRDIMAHCRSLILSRAKAEERAWIEVAHFYNSYRDNVLSELDKRLPRIPDAKGKQRATSQEVDDWSNPREYELPEEFRGAQGVELAKSVLEMETGAKSPLTLRLEGLEFKV